MAEELKKQGVEVELIEGSNGVFDVKIDGKLVFSKFESGRFPEPGEITKRMKA